MIQPREIDVLIHNADIFTADRDRPHISNGAIGINGNSIVALGNSKEINSGFLPKKNIDAGGAIVHPGFIETHLHMPSPVFLEMPIDAYGRSSKNTSYAALKYQSTDESTEALAAAAAVSMMRRGYTMFLESGTVFETDAFAAGLRKCGMRGMVTAPFGWDDVSSFRQHEPGYVTDDVLRRAPANLSRVVDDLARELKRNDDTTSLVEGYVCLYGEGSSSDELMQESISLSESHGVVFNQHQNFMLTWVNAEYDAYGMSGVARLARNSGLGPLTSLTHMNYLTEEDVDLVLSSGTNVIWCPNQALPRGYYNSNRCWHPSLYKQGVSISLGTDTALEYPLGSAGMTALLLSGMVGEPIHRADPFYMQTCDAARNLGKHNEIGTIAIGKKADVVIRAMIDISHSPMDDHGAMLASSSTMIPVDKVFIDGRHVIDDGQLIVNDHAEILASARLQRELMMQRAISA